jgi:CDP-diacylglycerol--serine O-phosphatidyltransferase
VAAIWTAQRGGIPLPPGRLRLAAGLIAAAAALDAIDGPVARRRRTTGPFGRELDSLADLAAFGVAPAVVLYDARLAAVPVAGEAAAAVWCVCAAWRLARFPLCQRDSGFTGCPVPLAAVTVTIAALAAPPLLTLLAVTTASLLMISTVSFPTWHAITRILRRKYQ